MENAKLKLLHQCEVLLKEIGSVGEKTSDDSNYAEKDDDMTERNSIFNNLNELYLKIYGLQRDLETLRMFLEGQNLYTEWLTVALKICKAVNKNSQYSTITDRLRPVVALAYNNRGFIKYLQVDFEGAIVDYTKSLKYDSSLACVYYNRGVVTYRLAFFDQAVKDMTTSVEMDPNSKEFKEGLERSKVAFQTSTGYDFDSGSIALTND